VRGCLFLNSLALRSAPDCDIVDLKKPQQENGEQRMCGIAFSQTCLPFAPLRTAILLIIGSPDRETESGE